MRKFILSCLLLATACSNASNASKGTSGSTSKDASTSAEAGTDALCPVIVKDEDCDKTLRPIVFVHGTYGSGDNFAHVASLLTSNGYCADRIVAVEYTSVGLTSVPGLPISLGDFPGDACTDSGAKQGCGKIDAVINKVLADNPDFTQVDLAGHSQGTLHCTTYLKDPVNAKKVAHYINISGTNEVANDVPTLSISSQHDLGGHPNHATGTKGPGDATADNVTEITFQDEDHFACAASTPSFKAIYNYLNSSDHDPTHDVWKYDTVQCGDDLVTIEGLAETFADNTPVAGRLEIREVGDVPRAAGPPAFTLTSDGSGHFGPLTQVKRNVAYEFKGFGADGKLIGYQYFTPFKRTNRLVRLLSPASGSDGSNVGAIIAAASTDNIKRAPNNVAITGRWSGGAFRQDLGGSLLVNGQEVLSDATAGKAALATANLQGGPVGYFMYDANGNGKTDLGLVTSGPFLAFTDVFMDATTPAFVELSLTPGSEEPSVTGETIKVSNWPSADALVLVMFQ